MPGASPGKKSRRVGSSKNSRGSRARAKAGELPAKPSTVAGRIDFIAEVMRTGRWVRGATGKELAASWQLHEKTIDDDAAEAWRRVCAEADDADKVRPTIAGTLRVALEQAADAKRHKETATLADTLSRVVGARAPERSEMTLRMKQLEDMPPASLHAKLIEQRKKLTEAIDALEQEHPELVSPAQRMLESAMKAIGVERLDATGPLADCPHEPKHHSGAGCALNVTVKETS